jgi:hypothetical protein
MNDLMEVVRPDTGEMLDIRRSATDVLAEERKRVTELRSALNVYASFLDEELNRRLDKENTRSATVGGWKIETKAPTTLTFDPDSLAVAIHDLIAEDLLGESVLEKVLIPQPDKVNRREVDKLLRHADSRVREHIRSVGVEEDQRRTVSVKAA